MSSANVEMLERAAIALDPLIDEVVFVGGATVGLWATDPAAPEFRPTNDVDVIVEVATRAAYYAFEERLREAGFANAPEGNLICRFRHRESDLILDAMPTDGAILGFEGRWLKEAFPHAVSTRLPSGRSIHVLTPAHLLATKLEAFSSRGGGDLYASADFEDIITLVDIREELGPELAAAPDALRSYVANEIGDLLDHESFASAGEGALSGGPETRERFELVLRPRLEAIAASP